MFFILKRLFVLGRILQGLFFCVAEKKSRSLCLRRLQSDEDELAERRGVSFGLVGMGWANCSSSAL